MAGKVLGIDLGTSSIGLSLRDTDIEGKVSEQLDYFTSVIFEAGVGVDKTGEFSRAAERRSHRSSRRLNQARRYRIWRTLEVLIEYGYCPLSKEDLKKWTTYDKTRDMHREYPIWADHFEKWVRLDFNCDGKPDYTSPYQLREELATHKIDLTNQTERYKLGRALYHIAQRRGFKSSKGETINEQENEQEGEDLAETMKKSELKKCGKLQEYMDKNCCPTVGCAFAKMEQEGIRVRANTDYQAVRDLYEKEVKTIFETQEIDANEGFGKAILSKKKGEGSIFFKRPLRSQKGTVGKCTLEKNKTRCPLSRPEFEVFRAWSLINNIRYTTSEHGEEKELTLEEKKNLFNTIFTRAKKTFKFEDITKYLKKEKGELYKLNYKDKTVVSGCPVVNKLKTLLGENWETATVKGNSIRRTDKTYNYEELWHKCFEAEDADEVLEFVEKHIVVENKEEFGKKMIRLWSAIGEGYSNLSLKAINNINRVLREGMIYTDAVLWAKVSDIVGEEVWAKEKDVMLNSYEGIKYETDRARRSVKLANEMIAKYKVLSEEEKDIYRDGDYVLDDNDKKEIKNTAFEMLTKDGWKRLSEQEQKDMLDGAAVLYQKCLNSKDKEYAKVPKLTDGIASFLEEQYHDAIKPKCQDTRDNEKESKIAETLYHPSAINIYAPQKEKNVMHNGVLLSKKLLGSPATDVFKNPMVMRVLHTLRRHINQLILDGKIDEDTRVVVEMARELNDANARWAIETYQREREKENAVMRKRMEEIFPDRVINETDIQQCRLLLEQAMLDKDCENLKALQKHVKELKSKDAQYGKDITKYSLWLEQNCRSIYTGKIIRLSELFNENKYDIEHTIPRSLCFDDSLANKTICEADYNRNVKKNRVPSELGSDFDAIKMRIQPWIERRNAMKELIEFWHGESKKAAAGTDRKNQCVRQQHLWKMEYDYWNDKVSRFLMERDKVGEGFRNSQLVDTRIISKYAFHFLKTVFSKVEVQRGNMTADFRKAFGIQDIEEKKNRDKHSHHAIDATMLTLIPTNKKRDRMLELFYDIEEKKDLLKGETDPAKISELRNDIEKEEKEFGAWKKQCNIHGVGEVAEFIEDNILIRHDSKDRALTPTKKKIRVRGRIKRDENGNAMYMTGDAIRGQIHEETWLGAITQFETDENGNRFVDTNKVYYVVRRELKFKKNASDSGFKSWDELEKAIVNKSLIPMMQSQYPDSTFQEAMEQGVFMLDKNGNKTNRIRHIRCYTSNKNPIEVKEQTYKSDKEYKNYLLAASGETYAMCKYINSKEKVIVKIYRLYDICQHRKLGIEDIPIILNIKGTEYRLIETLKSGMHLLLYKEQPEELKEMNHSDLMKRLYVLPNGAFESDGRLSLVKHLCALPVKDLGKGESAKDFSNLPNKIRCSASGLHYLLEHKDFEITTNGIEFK